MDTLDPVKLYFSTIRKIPQITKREIAVLIPKIHKGDKNAKKRMIEGNLRLVIPIARKYHKPGIPFSDLIEEGKVREITRQIQVLRKSLGCKFNDLVRIYFHGDPDLVALIEKNQNDIQKEVLIADSIQSFKPNILGKEVTINQAKIWLGIEKR